MVVKAESFQPQQDPIATAEDVVPLIIPMSMWDVLVKQAEVERCSPGEVLDRALNEYLGADGRLRILKDHMEQAGKR